VAIVTRAYSETDGLTAEASSINRVIDDLYSALNNGLNSANLADSAIYTALIADGAITGAKLSADSIMAFRSFS
jgi:hypothetical protein